MLVHEGPSWFVALLLGCAAVGCGSSEPTAAASNLATADSGTLAKDLAELYAYDWTVDPGVEAYWCGYRTLKEDLYISHFEPLMPEGTHHVTIGYREAGPADGFFAEGEGSPQCTGTDFGDVYAFVGTVGTEALTMPEGVAVKIPAGKQLVFGLHVLNARSAPLSGHAGVAVKRVDVANVENVAEILAVNNFMLNIPPGKVTQTGTCTMNHDTTVFAVLPHMHKVGVHMTTTVPAANGGVVRLLDSDYEFTDQRYTTLSPPIQLKQGDKARIECTYENPGPNTFTFGESTDGGEMCITFLYRYPAVGLDQVVNTNFGIPLPRGSCLDLPAP
jgi:hypothetical protein